MVKSKSSSSSSKLPKDQKCHSLIGPINSWFMPSASDLWTPPPTESQQVPNVSDTLMDCIQSTCEVNASLSYFVYGSIGCFCYGEIYHHGKIDRAQPQSGHSNTRSAIVKCLIDIKDDNSRISCVRFLKQSPTPVVMVLSENGSLVIHDCLAGDNLVQINKSELITRLVGPPPARPEGALEEPKNKKAKFNVTQQVNSCLWLDPHNAFIAVSLMKEKRNALFWLKLKYPFTQSSTSLPITSLTDAIDSLGELNLDLPQYPSPVCCLTGSLLDANRCVIAVAMDDGLISVVIVNFKDGQVRKNISLARHNDQICSLAFYTHNLTKFPLGLLTSVSRDGLVLVWDVDNEYYFADYQASGPNPSKSKINWFSASFASPKDSKQIYLLVSNPESGVSVLDVPDTVKSKIRLKENSGMKKKKQNQEVIRHHALIFSITFDPLTGLVLTSSLDGNHIFWTLDKGPPPGKAGDDSICVRPQFLYPSMTNNSRTHMLRFNPICEDLLAVIIGKAGIKFHKIGEKPFNSRFEMSPCHAFIARKIAKASMSPTSVAWHPSHEYKVAIGTLEGKVLRADITPRRSNLIESELANCGTHPHQRKTPEDRCNLFDVDYEPLDRQDETSINDGDRQDSSRKTDGIYSLCWGPSPVYPDDFSRLAVYAVGSISHRLFIYYNKQQKEASDKLCNYLDEFRDQSLPEAISEASEVAWKSSMDLMALGTTSGQIVIVRYLEESHADRSAKLFKRLAIIQGPLGSSYIQCLAWHPTTDRQDSDYYLIAGSANESPAFVFDLRDVLLALDVKSKLKIDQTIESHASNSGALIVSIFVHKLDAHKKAISDIAWNPHSPNQLATASFDKTCLVWSLVGNRTRPGEGGAQATARLSSKFCARDRLFTLEWSLVDADLIYTSGHDSTIWAWRPSQNLHKGGE